MAIELVHDYEICLVASAILDRGLIQEDEALKCTRSIKRHLVNKYFNICNNKVSPQIKFVYVKSSDTVLNDVLLSICTVRNMQCNTNKYMSIANHMIHSLSSGRKYRKKANGYGVDDSLKAKVMCDIGDGAPFDITNYFIKPPHAYSMAWAMQEESDREIDYRADNKRFKFFMEIS